MGEAFAVAYAVFVAPVREVAACGQMGLLAAFVDEHVDSVMDSVLRRAALVAAV